MATTTFTTRLPNPDLASDPAWTLWDAFIKSQEIPICNEEVVRRYQHIEQNSSRYLEANVLNHFLNLQHFGYNSHYANLAQNDYDLEQDEKEYPVKASVDALDAVFASKACRFTADSVVFKGVYSEPFYKIHDFKHVRPGQKIKFPGFVSTSVCREKALDFVRKHGILLVIQGLDLVDCIVPQNLEVKTTINAHVPEQEILLRRGVTVEVQLVVPATTATPQEVHLKVV